MPGSNKSQIGGGTYMGEPALEKLMELIQAELETKQDNIDEMSAEDVQRIWDEEMNPTEQA